MTTAQTSSRTEIGFKLTKANGYTSHGFVWPDTPGTVVKATGPFSLRRDTGDSRCPDYEGDGLCVARTIAGAQSGGQSFHWMTLVAWTPEHVLYDDGTEKVRVSQCTVISERIDLRSQIRAGAWAGGDLRDAILGGLNLRGTNLRGANLRGADLSDADLDRADLRGADLRGARMVVASLVGADLRGADLRGADLMGAIMDCAQLDGALR